MARLALNVSKFPSRVTLSGFVLLAAPRSGVAARFTINLVVITHIFHEPARIVKNFFQKILIGIVGKKCVAVAQLKIG